MKTLPSPSFGWDGIQRVVVALRRFIKRETDARTEDVSSFISDTDEKPVKRKVTPPGGGSQSGRSLFCESLVLVILIASAAAFTHYYVGFDNVLGMTLLVSWDNLCNLLPQVQYWS